MIEAKRPNFIKDFAFEMYSKSKEAVNSLAGRQKSASEPVFVRDSIDLEQTHVTQTSHLGVAQPSIDDLSNGIAFKIDINGVNKVGNFLYAQIAFFSSLTDICDRLRSVVKVGRQSALVSELTLLNQNFPAYLFIPLFVPTNDYLDYKVLRIALQDAVVLNSADRVMKLKFRF